MCGGAEWCYGTRMFYGSISIILFLLKSPMLIFTDKLSFVNKAVVSMEYLPVVACLLRSTVYVLDHLSSLWHSYCAMLPKDC